MNHSQQFLSEARQIIDQIDPDITERMVSLIDQTRPNHATGSDAKPWGSNRARTLSQDSTEEPRFEKNEKSV